jgi:hypothetical protein
MILEISRTMKSTIFWDVTPYNPAKVRRNVLSKEIFGIYCVFGFCPCPVFYKKLENTTFGELDLFTSSGEGGSPLEVSR